MKKKLIAGILILFIAGVSFFFYSQRDREDNAVRTSGLVEGIEVNLASKVQGRISEICCNEGDSVKQGQAAVRLESRDLEASLEQAAAGVERARADIRNTEAGIEKASTRPRSSSLLISAKGPLQRPGPKSAFCSTMWTQSRPRTSETSLRAL